MAKSLRLRALTRPEQRLMAAKLKDLSLSDRYLRYTAPKGRDRQASFGLHPPVLGLLSWKRTSRMRLSLRPRRLPEIPESH
jgi:hypothetical protein